MCDHIHSILPLFSLKYIENEIPNLNYIALISPELYFYFIFKSSNIAENYFFQNKIDQSLIKSPKSIIFLILSMFKYGNTFIHKCLDFLLNCSFKVQIIYLMIEVIGKMLNLSTENIQYLFIMRNFNSLFVLC